MNLNRQINFLKDYNEDVSNLIKDSFRDKKK